MEGNLAKIYWIELKRFNYLIKTRMLYRHNRLWLELPTQMILLIKRKFKSIYCTVTSYRLNDTKLSLLEIFKTYGEKTRKEAKEYVLYYDFHPFNSTEPILLALMIKDTDT